MVLWFLAEGVDQSVLVRYTGHAKNLLKKLPAMKTQVVVWV